jgi:hypothetical protein
VVSDAIYQDHVTGNGISCGMRDADDLAAALGGLQDPRVRRQLGEAGVLKMRAGFDWKDIAMNRLRDFKVATHG